jgi:hypothetical protein
MLCPLLNPIRFYDSALVPDYNSYFPNMDNITQRVNWVPGIHTNKHYYKEWRTGIAMYLQFEREATESVNLHVFKYDETTKTFIELETGSPIVGTDISPGGWTTNPIYGYTFTPSSDGTYYFIFDGDTLTSDKFIVTSDTNFIKQLVKIKYSNTENDYGCIFGTNYFNQFFTGFLSIGEPQNEISGFQDDRGDLIKLQGTPIRVANLLLNDIHYSYADHINMIFSLDTIEINGIAYQNSEPPIKEDIADSDLKNFSIKLLQTGNDYYY